MRYTNSGKYWKGENNNPYHSLQFYIQGNNDGDPPTRISYLASKYAVMKEIHLDINSYVHNESGPAWVTTLRHEYWWHGRMIYAEDR